MSLSYLQCETYNGPGTTLEGNAFVNNLWQQAAGEGISVFVASGDNAAAGCDDFQLGKFCDHRHRGNALAFPLPTTWLPAVLIFWTLPRVA